MSPYFVLAEHYAQQSLSGLAYSARPDAPVLPYVEPRRPLRRLATSLVRRVRTDPRRAPVESGWPA